tara:strand:- start:67 stop:645 length:579 start_codon:yes stop_codon:yes gene_type:complete
MRIILAVLFLILSLQSWTKADDIRDFELEKLGVGDSLLKFMTKKQIQNNDLKYYPSNSKFYTVAYTGNLQNYDAIEVMLKRNDKNFKIYMIRGGIFVKNLKECQPLRDNIVMEIKSIFSNPIYQSGKQEHYLYPNSFQYISQFMFNDSAHKYDNIRVSCYIFDEDTKKKHNFGDNLSVIVQSGIAGEWIENR